MIYIQSCSFESYNFLKYKRLFLDYNKDPKFIESFTLHLYSTLTLLNISKTKFLHGIVSSTMTDKVNDHFVSSDVMRCNSSYD